MNPKYSELKNKYKQMLLNDEKGSSVIGAELAMMKHFGLDEDPDVFDKAFRARDRLKEQEKFGAVA